MRSDLIDLEVYIHHETDESVLVSLDGESKKARWIPKSIIEIEPTVKMTKVVTMTIPQWKAEKEGLI
jgi:hypothetical protein